MVTIQGSFLAVTSPVKTVNDLWPAVILSAVVCRTGDVVIFNLQRFYQNFFFFFFWQWVTWSSQEAKCRYFAIMSQIDIVIENAKKLKFRKLGERLNHTSPLRCKYEE